jgi:S-methylmethionine-dependent homocysteine/selenocysteine methylase
LPDGNPTTSNHVTGKVVLLDAAMGKDLKMRGVTIPGSIWSANALLEAPEAVLAVHRENIDAGADVITTNTYGVIRSDLAKEGIEDRFEALNEQAAEIARQAVSESSRSVRIAGSLPPLNGSYRPDRVLTFEAIEPLYREQADLLAPHVDYLLCETMSHSREARAAASAAASAGKPFFVAFTLDDEQPGVLRSGESLSEAVASLAEYGPSGVLVNCCLPERISDAMPLLAGTGYEWFGGYANALTRVPKDWLLDGGKETDGSLSLRDDLTPQHYARFAADWLAAGARIVGGCCGTLASHTAALRTLIDSR